MRTRKAKFSMYMIASVLIISSMLSLDVKAETIPTGSSGNIEYEALFDPETYDIDYNLNGGRLPSGKSNLSKYTIATPKFTLVEPIRDGYTFIGWSGGSLQIDPDVANHYMSPGETILGDDGDTYINSGYIVNSELGPSDPEIPYRKSVTLNKGVPSDKTAAELAEYLETANYSDISDGKRKYIAEWWANTDTPYTVEHYKQKVGGDPSLHSDANFEYFETDSLTGTTDTKVTPERKTYEGFASPNGIELNIDGTGDAVLKYYYPREIYNLDVTPGDHIQSIRGKILHNATDGAFTETYEYGATVVLTVTPMPGYTVSEWSISDPDVVDLDSDPNTFTFIMPSHSVTFGDDGSGENGGVTVTPNDDTPYVVNHYQQIIGKPDTIAPENYSLIDTDNLTGTTDTQVTPERKEYTGFELPDSQEVNINGDGSTVVNYYYPREKHDLTLVAGTGIESVSGGGRYEFGNNSFTIDAVVKPGYTWIGWSGTFDETTKTYAFPMPEYNVELTASAFANTDTHYYVKHYKQKLGMDPLVHDSVNYECVDTDDLTGTTDTKVTPDRKEYIGFVAPVGEEINIDGTGDKVLEYYYPREVHTVNINHGDHIQKITTTGAVYIDDGGSFEESYEYDAAVRITVSPMPGYSISEWNAEGAVDTNSDENVFEFTMPNNDVTFDSIIVTPNEDTPYYVKHYKQILGQPDEEVDGNYAYVETDNLTGTTDTKVIPDRKEYIGFTSPEGEEINIDGTGDKVLDYYYKRNKYAVTANSMITNADLLVENAVGCTIAVNNLNEYEAEVAPEITVNPGFKFIRWDVENLEESAYLGGKTLTDIDFKFKMPANNVKITAVIEALTVGYKVNHYLQKLDAAGETSLDPEDKVNNFELKDTDNLTAPASSSVTPDFHDYDGFEKPAVKETVTVAGDGSTVVDYYYLRRTDCEYTVEHYLMNLDPLTGYTLEDTDTFSTIYGIYVTPDTKTYPGFWSPDVERTDVKFDGSTCVKYYYTRRDDCVYTVNHYYQKVDLSGYELKTTYTDVALFEAPITPELIPMEGFDSPQTQTINITHDGSDVFNYYYNRTVYNYTVNHYVQNLGDDEYTLRDSDVFQSTYETTITPEPRIYDGFTFEEPTRSIVVREGASVDYYYTRNTCNVTVTDIGRYPGTTQQPDVLGVHSATYPFETPLSGTLYGSDETDNAYYNGYRFVEATTGTVSSSGLDLYRYFDYITTSYSEDIDLNDYVPGTHMESCDVTLMRTNGVTNDVADRVIYSSNGDIHYSKDLLPQYDKNGNRYEYNLIKEYNYSYSLNNLFVTVSNDGSAVANPEDGTITVTNPLANVVVGIQKVDYMDDVPIPGESKVVETSEYGAVSCDGLGAGIYRLKKLSVPNDYIFEDYDAQINIDPEYAAGGTVDSYCIYVSNDDETDITDTAACKKIYSSDNKNLITVAEPQVIRNRRYGSITIHAVDSNNNTGLGAEKYITSASNGETVAISTTDKAGDAIVERLKYDTYKIENTKAADGYVKMSNSVETTLTEENPDMLVTIKKDKNNGYDIDVEGNRKTSKQVLYFGSNYEKDNSGSVTNNKNGNVATGSLSQVLNGSGLGINGSYDNVNTTSKQMFDTVATVNGSKVIIIKDGVTSYTIKDEVKFANYGVQGAEYTMVGYLVDKATGEAIHSITGGYISAKKAFTNSGLVTLEMEFDIPAGILKEGQNIVVYETVVGSDGKIVKEHTDINDKDQTISVKGYVPIQTGVFPRKRFFDLIVSIFDWVVEIF